MVALAVVDGLTLLQERIVRMESQRLSRHGEDIVLLEGEDSHVGRQSRLQLQVVVRSRDHHLVGHHITLRLGILSHLSHASLKLVVGEGVHREAHALPLLHATDVSLIDISYHAHVRKILRNHEELRGVKRGGHRLTLFHSLREDHAVDGRGNRGIAQIRLCLLHTLARGVHLLPGLLV